MSIGGTTSLYSRFRAAGVDTIGTSYESHALFQVGNAAPASTYAGASGVNTYFTFGNDGSVSIDLHNPQKNNWTSGNFAAYSFGTGYQYVAGSIAHPTTTQFDGITFIPSAGNMTGELTVYGYNGG